MSDKIKLTFDNLLKLREVAYQNGTTDAFITLLLQWAEAANNEINTLITLNAKLEKYKDTLEEVGVITFTLTSKNENDPEQLLADIIDFHVTVATDPKVNGGYRLVKDSDIFGTAEDWKVNDD